MSSKPLKLIPWASCTGCGRTSAIAITDNTEPGMMDHLDFIVCGDCGMQGWAIVNDGQVSVKWSPDPVKNNYKEEV